MFPQRCSTYHENLVKKYQSQPELLKVFLDTLYNYKHDILLNVSLWYHAWENGSLGTVNSNVESLLSIISINKATECVYCVQRNYSWFYITQSGMDHETETQKYGLVLK